MTDTDITQLIINMHKNGIGIKKISAILEISNLRIYKCLEENNLLESDKKYIERDKKVCYLYKNGYKITQIADELKINRHTVTDILKRKNVYKDSNIKKSINDISKEERNKSIIDLYTKGLSMREVAEKLNISASTVKNVLIYYNIEIRPAHQKGHSKGTSKNRKYFFDLDYFEKIDTEEKAYWLGFLYADGYVSYKGTISLGLQEKDKDHLEKLKKSIKAEQIELQYKKNTKSYSLNLGSVKMANDLIKLGCTQAKSLILEFPTIEQVPEHLVHHFMRGYFDGDGCIYVPEDKNHCYFSVLGTHNFLDKYEEILLKNIHKDTWNENTESIHYGGKNQIQKIFNYLYKDATIYLDRKYEKFKSLLPF